MGHSKPSQNFQMIDCVAQAVQALWAQRVLVVRLAAIPVLVKAMTVFLFIIMGVQDNILRQGLYALPAYFVEGFFVAVMIRLALYGEQWPFFLTGDAQEDQKRLTSRRRAIKACGLMYVLLRLISVVVMGVGMAQIGAEPQTVVEQEAALQEAAGSAGGWIAAMGAGALLLLTLWSYRYFVLYVPIALGFSPKAFLQKIWGLKASFHLLGVSLCCMVPVIVIFIVLDNIVQAITGGGMPTTDYLIYSLFFSILQGAMDTTITALMGVSLAYYVVWAMQRTHKKS